MVQVSEFGLIVGTVAVVGGFIEGAVLGFLTLVALISMSISVYLINYNDWIFNRVRPKLARWEQDGKHRDEMDEYHDHVVVIGFDEIARRAILLLDDHYEDIVVIDRNISEIEAIEEAGYDAIFGDVKYEKIRKEAGIKYASVIFSSSVQQDINEILVTEANPDATIFAEADWHHDAVELYDAGVDFVILAPYLAAEQLKLYLEVYLNDPEHFETVLDDDLDILRSDELFPTMRTPWGNFND